MTWLNHALMSGTNHCLFGVALGASRWVYIDENKAAWLCTLRFDIASRAGNVDFQRFGVFPGGTPSIEQTFSFSVNGAIAGAALVIDDITETGSGVAIVTCDEFDVTPSFSWIPTFGNRNIRGAFELVVTGSPPSAVVTPHMVFTEAEAAGELFGFGDDPSNHRTVQLISWEHNYSMHLTVAGFGTMGHRNKLFGIGYKNGVLKKMLRTITNTSDSTGSATPIGDGLSDYPVLFEFASDSQIVGEYKIEFDGVTAGFTATHEVSSSGTGRLTGYNGYLNSWNYEDIQAVQLR